MPDNQLVIKGTAWVGSLKEKAGIAIGEEAVA